MSEFLRIFGGKKRIAFLVGLLVLNLVFILKDNYNLADRSRDFEKAIAEYQAMAIGDAYEKNQENIERYYSQAYQGEAGDISEDKAIYFASLHEQIKPSIIYIQEYAYKYQNMIDNAGKMISSGLVGGKETFAYKNIRQTLIDFASIDGLSVKLVNDRTINQFLDFEMTDYMMVLAILLIVSSFVEEQKKGLFYIVRSCSGRNKLIFTRQVVLLLSSFIVTLIFYSTSYIAFGYVHGFVPLDTLIQSFPAFDNCYTVMGVGMFLFVLVLLKTLVIYMLGNVLWFIMNLFNNMLASVGVVSVWFVLEYVTYRMALSGGIYDMLKYCNIFNYMNIEETYTTYRNLDIFGKCVEIMPFSVVSLVVMTVVVVILATVIAAKKRYIPGTGLKLWQTVRARMAFVTTAGHTSLTLHEAYRFFKCNAALIIMIIFGVLMWWTYEEPRREYDLTQVYINRHYDHIEGELGEEVDEYLADVRIALESDIAELEAYVETNPEYISSVSYRYAKEDLDRRQYAISYVEGENMRLKYLAEEGYDVCHVNALGYRYIFELSSISTYVSYLIPILFIVLMAASVFSYDNEYNFGRFLKATPRGRKPVLHMRLLYVTVCTVTVWAVMQAIELNKVYTTFGLHETGAEVASLNIFARATSHMSILSAMIIMYSLRLFVLICVGLTAMCLSSMVQSNKLSYIINLVVLVLPAAFVVIGAELFGWISYMDVYKAHSNVTDILLGNYIALIPYIICMVIGVASYVKLRRKMC